MTVWRLFWVVASLSALSFGGGSIMLAGLERELVGSGAMAPAQFGALVALGQATPGPLAGVTTVAAGRLTLGAAGLAAAYLGLVAVGTAIALLIGRVPRSWMGHPVVRGALGAVPTFTAAVVLYLAVRIAAGAAEAPLAGLLLIGLPVAVGRLWRVPAAVLVLGGVAVGVLVHGLG